VYKRHVKKKRDRAGRGWGKWGGRGRVEDPHGVGKEERGDAE